jgi:hypothetical protein
LNFSRISQIEDTITAKPFYPKKIRSRLEINPNESQNLLYVQNS